MAKRPDTLATVLLALELLHRIPRNRKVSAPELHGQLKSAGIERDLRTIQRQLEMLAEHFDIERDDRSKPYGYRFKERAKGLMLPRLTEQESLLLTLTQQHLRNILPADLMKSMDGFFFQARSNLGPRANARREREWLSKVRVVSTSQPLLAPKIAPGIFETVSNALYANHWLKIVYRNMSGDEVRADVMPLGLAQQGPRLYLVSRFKGFTNERSLALHRFISVEMQAPTFTRPKDFDLEKYDDDGRFGFGDGKRIRLSFRVTKDAGQHLLESPLSCDQIVQDFGDKLEITATVVDTAQLDWWLKGFGNQVSAVRKVAATTTAGQS